MMEKEKKEGAKRFAEAWANRGDEKQETQVFWISLLREVFGVEAPEKIIQFEKRAMDVSHRGAEMRESNPANPENPCDINPCDENVVTRIKGINGIYDYIISNPPFVGVRLMSKEQKEDALSVFGAKWKNAGNLDYVSCWYKKAADLMRGTRTCAALVSTNSVSQGESVAILWKPLFEAGCRPRLKSLRKQAKIREIRG